MHSIILVAEGAASAFDIDKEINKKMKMDTRVIILGHLQRGGTPSAFDRMLASTMGAAAVDAIMDGQGGKMITWQKGSLRALDISTGLEGKKKFSNELYDLTKILSI